MKNRSQNSAALAKNIRASAKSGEPVETELATSQRIIARVTDGIYREPWAAFRELIANSYDADAENVVVETGLPEFDKITVRDDGNGMTPDTLAYVLKNIGGSSKRTKDGVSLHTASGGDQDLSPGGRPLIGKIGIGLFAVAQLTQHFQIITKAKGDKYRSSATVLLKTHDELKLKDRDDDEEFVAGSVTIVSEQVTKEEIETHGTTVVLYALRPEVRRAMQSVRLWNATLAEGVDGDRITERPVYHIGLLRDLLGKGAKGLEPFLPWESGDNPAEKFKKLVDAAGDVSSRGKRPANLEHFDEYFRMLWKLSLSLPLEYVEEHPFDINGESGVRFYDVPDGKGQAKQISLRKNQTLRDKLNLTSGLELKNLDFCVTVDEVELRRPIVLPHKLRKDHAIGHPVMMVASEAAPFKDSDLERAGGKLDFEAYLYWNSKIIPKDTVGVVLRVRDASGTLFDASFLNYQVSEQTRLRQITAEIFVKSGLDSAINIDRESFNYSHPHYLYIQRWIHKALRLLVNRLKALAKTELEKKRKSQAAQKRAEKEQIALDVWSRRYGEDADPPITENATDIDVPEEVGAVEIDWSAVAKPESSETAAALAVVLEAYGVLSTLSAEDRAHLISDILEIFEID